MEGRLILRGEEDVPAGILARHIPDDRPYAGHGVARIPDFVNAAYPEPIQQSGWQFAGMVFSGGLAWWTSGYSWWLFNNYFLENLFSWEVTCIYFEVTYLVYYACNTNWDELVGRVRSEYRNHAGWGSAVLCSKVVLASLPLLGIGMLSALLKTIFSEQIENSYPLQIICMPPISRMIDAVVALPVYMLTWKVINKLHPVRPYRYTFNAPLNSFQRISDKFLRAFNSTSVTKFSFTIYRRFGPAFLLHDRNIPLVIGAVDAGLYCLDNAVANMMPNNPFKRAQNQANELQLASVNNDIEAQAIIEIDGPSLIARNAIVRGRIYSDNESTHISSTGGKVMWNIGIISFALGMVVVVNLISNVVREDKETLAEPFYTGYLFLLALVSQYSRLLFQTGVPYLVNKTIEVAPRIKERITNCCATTFSKKNPALPAPSPTDTTPLITRMESPTTSRLRLSNNQEHN